MQLNTKNVYLSLFYIQLNMYITEIEKLVTQIGQTKGYSDQKAFHGCKLDAAH
jgi:hypothetical protein